MKNKEKVYLICHANGIKINILVSKIHFHYLYFSENYLEKK